MAEASSPSGSAELTHEERPWGDTYVGSAEALIAAGLVTADQLPGGPGKNNFTCTFYDGRPVKKGATNHLRNERYLQIARRGRRFEVFRGVSDDVSDKRREVLRAQRDLDAAAKYQEEKREAASKKTSDDYRDFCLTNMNLAAWSLDGGDGLYSFRFAPDVRARIEGLTRQLRSLIASSPVLPLRPDVGNGGKAHLRLAWSAS